MITINIDKAKTIAHVMRRAAREEEFKPHDEIIMKQIPGNSFEEAEAAREAIRVKYAAVQDAINASTSIDDIKSALRGT